MPLNRGVLCLKMRAFEQGRTVSQNEVLNPILREIQPQKPDPIKWLWY